MSVRLDITNKNLGLMDEKGMGMSFIGIRTQGVDGPLVNEERRHCVSQLVVTRSRRGVDL